MLEILPVLSSESVQKLKRAVVKNPEIIEESLDSIAGTFSLNFVPTHYQIDPVIELLAPEGFAQEKNNDVENSTRLLKFLPLLNPANATDERLWTTLSFGRFSSYLNKRWPFRQSDENKLSSHVKNHWFATGVRGRMRNNGISRLWWMGHVASKVPELSTTEVHSILFANSDYRSQLLDRNSTTNSLVVLSSILQVTQTAMLKGIKYDRDCFRALMMEINLLGGRKNLAAIDQDSLVEILSPLYYKCYSKK